MHLSRSLFGPTVEVQVAAAFARQVDATDLRAAAAAVLASEGANGRSPLLESFSVQGAS